MIGYQVPLLLEQDQTPLNPKIVMMGDSRWDDTIEIWKHSNTWALDMETYPDNPIEPLDALNPWKGIIRLIQVGLPHGVTIVVDCGGRNNREEKQTQLAKSGFIEILRKKCFDDSKVVGANLKFDLIYLFIHYGIKVRNPVDLMIMSQIYWAGLEKQHSLKAVLERLGEKIDKTEQTSDWSWELTNSQLNYAAEDTQASIRGAKKLKKLIEENDRLEGTNLLQAYTFSCNSIPGWVEMEAYGMPVDLNILKSTIKKYEEVSNQVIEPFRNRFPKVNPNSPSQILPALKAELGIEPTVKDKKTGVIKPSVSAEALAKYWHIPELKALSLYCTCETLIGYMKGVQESIHTTSGYPTVSGVYKIEAPKGFGRSTCGADKKGQKVIRPGVNLQNPSSKPPSELEKYNLPKMRDFFKPPEGYSLLVFDLSQAHARIAAQASKDPTMLALYNDGMDAHCILASDLAKFKNLSWSPEDIAKFKDDKSSPNRKQAKGFRDVAKTVFYGSLNAQGAATLKDSCDVKGIKVSLEEAKVAIQSWKSTYKVLYNFMWNILNTANKKEKIYKSKEYATIIGLSGRRLYLEKWLNTYEPSKPKSAKLNDSCSFYWMSTEADVIKWAIWQITLLFDAYPQWDATLRNCCHDELDIVVKKEYDLECSTAVFRIMDDAMRLFIDVIPVNEADASPEKCIVGSWSDK